MSNLPKGTFRLWDREFNLLAEWQEGDEIPLRVTRDYAGHRVSGIITGFTAESP